MGRVDVFRLLSRLYTVPHPESQRRAAQVWALRGGAGGVASKRADDGVAACLGDSKGTSVIFAFLLSLLLSLLGKCVLLPPWSMRVLVG